MYPKTKDASKRVIDRGLRILVGTLSSLEKQCFINVSHQNKELLVQTERKPQFHGARQLQLWQSTD